MWHEQNVERAELGFLHKSIKTNVLFFCDGSGGGGDDDDDDGTDNFHVCKLQKHKYIHQFHV